MSLSSIQYGKFNPPPPPVYPAGSIMASSVETQHIQSTTPSNPYISGLPVQFLSIPEDSDRTTNIQPEISIDFEKTPFTYLNFSNITADSSEQFTVFISNVPLGTVFILNGPTSWTAASGILTLTDTDSSGVALPNASLTIDARGTVAIPTAFVNIIVVRNSTGLLGRAMS